MEKNNCNKNLIIYNIQNYDKTSSFLIIVSLKKGWIILPLKYNKNKQLDLLIFGYNKLYTFFFKLKGFGYKWKYLLKLKDKNRNIYFKLGFTHRISLIIIKNLKIKLKKRRLIIKSRSYLFIRNKLNLLFFLYKTYLYNKKGIYLRGTKFKLKISKKKSKF